MSPTVNPLVAGRLDHKDAWSGVWIAEDIELLHQGISAGNWIDTTLGGVGTTLDALAFISDPLGSLVQYGVARLIPRWWSNRHGALPRPKMISTASTRRAAPLWTLMVLCRGNARQRQKPIKVYPSRPN